MWRSWPKTSSSSPTNSEITKLETPTPPSPIFRCSSFKDIETLCLDSDFAVTANHQPFPEQPHRPQPSTRRRSIFHRVRTANALLRQWNANEEGRIVVYCTSLRVVRSTFEACRAVQSILHGFRVAIDERDVAMDLGFMSELRERLGRRKDKLTLPRVFIGGRYIGGAEEVLYLHEIGELKNLVQPFPLAAPATCATCGGYRFILCAECSGSHKIFSDKLGFRSCPACNENGLIRCPHCSSHF